MVTILWPSASHKLSAGRGSGLDVDGSWLIQVVAVTFWGGRLILKIGQHQSLPHRSTLPFTNDFCTRSCCLIAFTHTLSELELVLSNLAAALAAEFMWYSKSSVVMSTVFIASSPGVDSISRDHYLFSSISDSSSVRVLSWEERQQPSPICRMALFGCSTACGIFVPWAGITPGPPALGVQSLNHWQPGKAPGSTSN